MDEQEDRNKSVMKISQEETKEAEGLLAVQMLITPSGKQGASVSINAGQKPGRCCVAADWRQGPGAAWLREGNQVTAASLNATTPCFGSCMQ